MSRRTPTRLAAGLTAAVALLGSGVAVAEETTPPEPEPTELEPLPAPKDNVYAVGQSLQIRVNADAEPNSSLANFRWSVTQLTVQGPEDGKVTVPVPEGGIGLRNLDGFGSPPVEDGVAQLTADVRNGVGLARTVSLFPGDREPAISLSAEFTLDGEPITASDLVGKSGVVTAQYTLTNNTTAPREVTVTDLAGNPVTTSVDADVPMVAIAQTLLPQDYAGLNTGLGTFGADGRGNNQVQWVALPFAPISSTGTATFGWAARVTDAVIPSMLIQVAPIYLPEDADDSAAEDTARSLGIPLSAPNLDPAVAQIQAGVADIVAGIQGLTAAADGPDPLTEVQERLNNFFTEFGDNIEQIGVLLNPSNPDSITAQVPALQSAIQTVLGPLGAVTDDWPDFIAQVRTLNTLLSNPAGQVACRAAVGDQVPDARAFCQQLRDATGFIVANADRLQGNLDILVPALRGLDALLGQLNTALTELAAQVEIIGRGLATTSVDLPTLDAVIASIVSEILNSVPGQQLTGGLDEVSAGLGQARAILSTYIAELVVQLRTAADTATAAAGDANAAVVQLKGSVAGLLQAAHTSPLVYGGDPATAPPGTVLAGAYEFRVDAADPNGPLTLPRILFGLLVIVFAAWLAFYFRTRDQEQPESTDAPI